MYKLLFVALFAGLLIGCGGDDSPESPDVPGCGEDYGCGCGEGYGCGCGEGCGCGCGCAEDVEGRVRKLVDDAMKRIKAGDTEGAKGLLDEATELKDDVSAELQKAIEDAMKALQVGDIATGLDKTGLPGR